MTSLITGREKEPIVMAAYGEAGSGKSSFALGAPNPVFVGPERNKELNALKFPRTESQDQLLQYLREIESGKHDSKQIRTVVLDAISTQESIIHKGILAKEPTKTMATACGGFGKANEESLKQLLQVRDGLDAIVAKKEMNIIVLSHCLKTDFNDPVLMSNYDTYEIALHKGKKKDHANYFIDWASSVLFFHWKSFATEDKRHALGVGKRVIRTECRPSHMAKNRYNLPETIEMLDDSSLLMAGQKPQTFGLVENYINQFYQGGGQANDSQNVLNMLEVECKKIMANINDDQIRMNAMAAFVDEFNKSSPIETKINNLNVIKNRLFEITSNQ